MLKDLGDYALNSGGLPPRTRQESCQTAQGYPRNNSMLVLRTENLIKLYNKVAEDEEDSRYGH